MKIDENEKRIAGIISSHINVGFEGNLAFVEGINSAARAIAASLAPVTEQPTCAGGATVSHSSGEAVAHSDDNAAPCSTQQPVDLIALVNDLIGELDYDCSNWPNILADNFKAKWEEAVSAPEQPVEITFKRPYLPGDECLPHAKVAVAVDIRVGATSLQQADRYGTIDYLELAKACAEAWGLKWK